MLTIKLEDGSEYTAQFDTMTAVLPLLKPMMRDGEDIKAMNGELLLPRIFQGLGDTEFVKDLAAGLLTLFPTLPSDRVWFGDTSKPVPYGVAGLEITEIFAIIARCLESVSNSGALNPDKIAVFKAMVQPKLEPQAATQKAIVPKGKKKR